jgi:pimeloyl-ACP methyl ester carboxylesterase
MHDDHGLPGEDVIAHGMRLHVVRHGRMRTEGDPVLLFVHGAGATGRLWSDVARDLEHTHRSVIPDLAGCGESERADKGECAPQAQAELLLAMLDALGHTTTVVIGHGTGGAIAAGLAALAADRVLGVALVSTPLHTEVWHEAVAHTSAVGALAARAHHKAADAAVRFAAPALARLGRGLTDPAGLDTARAGLARDGRPVLVLWGEEDTATPAAYGERLASELDATWIPIAGAGHLVPVERPERVAEELAGFLVEAKIVA